MPLRSARRASRAGKAAAYRSGVRAAVVRGRRFARRRMRAKMPVQRSLGIGFPKMIKMTHKYVDTPNILSTGLLATYRFRANGMFDPNQTGAGHQPLYFDQMALLYNHYTIIGSKITVRFVPTATSSVPQYVGVNLNDDTSTASIDINNIAEQTQSRTRAIAYTPERPVTIVQKYSAKKMYGGSILGNADLRCTPTSDPSEQAYFTCYSAPLDGSSTVGCYLAVTIEYIALWRELKDIASS